MDAPRLVARACAVLAVAAAAVLLTVRAQEHGWSTIPAPVPILTALLLATAVLVWTRWARLAWVAGLGLLAATVLVGLSSGFMLAPAALAFGGALFVAGPGRRRGRPATIRVPL